MDTVIIVFIVFGSVVTVFKLLLDFVRERSKMKSGAGSSTTTSELKALMREAVDEAVDDRLGRIERRLEEMEAPRQLSAPRKALEQLEAPPAPPIARDRDTTR